VTISKLQRRSILRSAAESQANIQIEVIPGIALAPRTVGESYHYETKSGSRIWHPSAYSKRGWSSMVYVASTRRVIVGEQWINVACNPLRDAILARFAVAA
jgi:hypothetical protein